MCWIRCSCCWSRTRTGFTFLRLKEKGSSRSCHGWIEDGGGRRGHNDWQWGCYGMEVLMHLMMMHGEANGLQRITLGRVQVRHIRSRLRRTLLDAEEYTLISGVALGRGRGAVIPSSHIGQG